MDESGWVAIRRMMPGGSVADETTHVVRAAWMTREEFKAFLAGMKSQRDVLHATAMFPTREQAMDAGLNDPFRGLRR